MSTLVDPGAADVGVAPDTVTLGVAVAIPEPHSRLLTDWRRRAGDGAAELTWPHVTLLPPTPVPVAEVAATEEHLAAAAAQLDPFAMHLAGTGTFRPISPVVFVQVSAGVAQCELLESAIRCGPLSRELEFPYHPHVTVAHDVENDMLDEVYDGLADFTARFPVDRFVLFSRGADHVWRWGREFPLGLGPAGEGDESGGGPPDGVHPAT